MSWDRIVKLPVSDADHPVDGPPKSRIEQTRPRQIRYSVTFLASLGSKLKVNQNEANKGAMGKKVLQFIAECLIVTVPGWAKTLTVTKVEPGDVIVLGENWKTRLTGIRAPVPDDPAGYQALDFTKPHVEGAVIKVFTWTKDNTAAGIVRDEYGLPRATVLFGRRWSKDLAESLLAKGLARIDEETMREGCEHYRDIEA